MPNWTVEQIPFVDHWRSFKDPSIAELFDVDSNEMQFLSNYTRDSSGRYSLLSSSVKLNFYWKRNIVSDSIVTLITAPMAFIIQVKSHE